MEYASSASTQMKNTADKPIPELGVMKLAAERLSMAATKVENFNARFIGSHQTSSGSDCESPEDSYRNDISAIFTQIDRLEAALSALDTIG